MKAPQRKKPSPARISQIALLRIGVAAAESNWKSAKEHWSQAKRRRKLARMLAKRAKKAAKQAETNLAEAREALAQAEAGAAAEVRRVARRRTLKSDRAVTEPAKGPPIAKRKRVSVRRASARSSAVKQSPAPMQPEALDTSNNEAGEPVTQPSVTSSIT